MISATAKITRIAYCVLRIAYCVLRIAYCVFHIALKVKFNVTLKGGIYKRAAGVYHGPVAQVLGIPIDHDVVINFDGFRRMIDALNGINLYVPDAIDEPLFPDESYGTYRLLIPEGYQHMDGELALAYAQTRHGNSDIYRAQRQHAALNAVWPRVMSLEQLPALPSFLREGASQIERTLS